MIHEELEKRDVVDGKTFARFCQQRYGTPYPTIKSLRILQKQAKALFEEHPDCTWQTLADVARWCHGKKRRVAEAYMYVNQFRWAYADGAIDLMPTVDLELEGALQEALEYEEDPEWRYRLMVADGVKAKRAILNRWRSQRAGEGQGGD